MAMVSSGEFEVPLDEASKMGAKTTEEVSVNSSMLAISFGSALLTVQYCTSLAELSEDRGREDSKVWGSGRNWSKSGQSDRQ